jgi:hypothetical protein
MSSLITSNLGSAATSALQDDWEVQFNETAKEVSGLDWPAYKQNITAKPSYGHAVALVG